ncbi:hypothetical protein NFJ02_17g27290 [Pycnococcus provasolii]
MVAGVLPLVASRHVQIIDSRVHINAPRLRLVAARRLAHGRRARAHQVVSASSAVSSETNAQAAAVLAAKKAIDTDAPAIVLKSAATGQAVTLPAWSDGDSAREFAERTGFPVEKLYVDESRALYKALELHGDLDGSEGLFFDPKVVEGVRRLFFNSVTGERIKGNEDSIKSSIKNYKPLMPKESRDTVQQGGTFVFKGTDVVYARKDEATADHAPIDDVIAAAVGAV